MTTKTSTYWVTMYDTGQDADYLIFENEIDALKEAREWAGADWVTRHLDDGGVIEVSVWRTVIPVNAWECETENYSWWNHQGVRVHVLLDVATVSQFVMNASGDSSPAGVELRRIKRDGTESFVILCEDFVANAWDETFPTLSLALARLAVLAKCAEDNWDTGFINDGDEPGFVDAAKTFLRGQVSSVVG